MYDIIFVPVARSTKDENSVHFSFRRRVEREISKNGQKKEGGKKGLKLSSSQMKNATHHRRNRNSTTRRNSLLARSLVGMCLSVRERDDGKDTTDRGRPTRTSGSVIGRRTAGLSTTSSDDLS